MTFGWPNLKSEHTKKRAEVYLQKVLLKNAARAQKIVKNENLRRRSCESINHEFSFFDLSTQNPLNFIFLPIFTKNLAENVLKLLVEAG